MEAWKDELYHWGVKGMKWKNKKKNGSAIAEDFKSDAREMAYDRHWTDDKKYKNWSMKQERRFRRNAKAIESGRNAMRQKRVLSNDTGKGLYRRGSGLKTDKPASGGYNRKKPSSAQTSFRRTRKDRAAKYVKRVLS